jgi:hypothetical protein
VATQVEVIRDITGTQVPLICQKRISEVGINGL